MTDQEQPATWNAVAEALRSGALFGSKGDEIRLFETHMSLVAVRDNRVYKLKKPVRLAYVDYGTRERRLEMCRRELTLNRRLAPDLYLDVRGVRRRAQGFELCDANDAAAVEHLVEMVYVDQSDMLAIRVDHNQVQYEELAELARLLAQFHLSAEPAAPPAGTPDAVKDWFAKPIAAVRAAGGTLLDAALEQAACGFVERWFDVNAPLLDRRVDGSHIRDGHGDLRLEHVFMGHPVQVLDCVEFDPSLRAHDVLADLAFLVMELQLAEREDLSRTLIDSWAEAGGPLDEQLLWAYAVCRALIRVEVALDRCAQLPPDWNQRIVVERAEALLALAVRLSWRARPAHCIVFAGLSGSGKTALSRTLAERWGLERTSSDDVRKRLIGLGRNDHAPAAAYEDWVSKEVYERLGREAGRELTAGRSVVVDATFRRSVDAQAFIRALRSAGGRTQPVTVACVADPETLRARVADRAERGGSDADAQVLDDQLAAQDALSLPVGISGAIELSTEGRQRDALARAERLVLDITVT